ncbi:MAG: hypothetical protein JXM69_10495 [Anaerolineae bacterium]|nr:hypothetical protein [Anaerolineae bacterium]
MAKRSRRAQRRPIASERTPEITSAESPTPDTSTGQLVKRKTIDFVQEYAYVYKELRNVFIIAVLMFVVLVGLSFVI